MSYRDSSESPKRFTGSHVDRRSFLHEQLRPSKHDEDASSIDEPSLGLLGLYKRFIEDPLWFVNGTPTRDQSRPKTFYHDMMINNEIAKSTHRVLEKHGRNQQRNGTTKRDPPRPKISLSSTDQLCFYMYTQPDPKITLELKDLGWSCQYLEYRPISLSTGYDYRRPRYQSWFDFATFGVLLRYVSFYILWSTVWSYVLFVRFGYRFF
jgi:hypothetical protein